MDTAISSVRIKGNKILLVKKKNTWILPGGKPNPGESDIVCLYREHKEELPHALVIIHNFYKEVTGTTPHRNRELSCKSYFATISGNITPGAEILESGYFSLKQTLIMPVSDITRKIITSLEKDGHLT